MRVLEARLLWGGTVISVERIGEGGALVVGEADDAAFRLSDPGLPGPRLSLARVGRDGAFISLPDGLVASVDGRDVSSPFVLEPGARARIPVGALEVALSWATREPRVLVPLTRALDLLYTRVLASLLALQAAFVVALLITPSLPDDDDDLLVNPSRYRVQVRVPPKKEPRPLASNERSDEKAKRDRAPVRERERRAAAPRRRASPSAAAIARATLDELGLGRVAAASVLGGGLLGDGAKALDGLRRPALVDGSGAGGVAGRGLGGGGGGDPLGIGALGGGGPGGNGGGEGFSLCGDGPCEKERQPVVVDRPPVAAGALSREEIQRVVRRHLKQLQFCYEKELQRSPELEGKVAVLFVIAPSGLVASASAKESTLPGDDVERCVLRVVRRMSFPRPRGGGQVVVTYPFVFSTAGD